MHNYAQCTPARASLKTLKINQINPIAEPRETKPIYAPVHNPPARPDRILRRRAIKLNASAHPCVKGFVRVIRLLPALLAVSAFSAETPLNDLLSGVENRYNQAKTLQVLFKEVYTPAGRPQRMESGILMLRKPLRMRWDYTEPKGKLCIADGKNIWIYTPEDKKATKTSMKESEDMRAPLAFLLGKLHFQKEFRNIKAVPENGGTRVTAEPRSDSLPYSQVEFVVNSDHQIREVKVTGFDKSILDFTFDQERMDPKLDANLFQFHAPPGTQVEEGGQ